MRKAMTISRASVVLSRRSGPNPGDTQRPRPYTDLVARRAEDLVNDPVLVLIEDEGSDLTVKEWLASLKEDGATEVNANAAEILREIREHGEH